MALMKELVKAITSSLKEGNQNAVIGLENALKEKQISVNEWNIGHAFRECFGEEAFTTLRNSDVSETARFFRIQEAAGGVSTAAFANVNRPFAYTAFLEPYQYPMMEFSKAIPTTPLPQGSAKFLRIPGVTNIGREALLVEEGDAYGLAGVSENYIETPEVVKRGKKVPVTKEALYFDRTGQLVEQCRKVGEAMALDREYRAVNAVVDIGESRANGFYRYRWGKSPGGLQVIATYGDSAGNHNWDNLAASNAFTDFANMNTAWLRLMAQTDPFTGEPIYFQPRHLLVGPSLAFSVPRVLQATITTAVGGFPTSGNVSQSTFDNPVNTVVGGLTPVGTKSMIYENQNTTASAATTWYLGDLNRAFGYLEAWAPRVDSLGAGSTDDFDRDIALQFKVSEMGTYFLKEPRAIVRCTA
jgi:hypothetical protein